MTKPAIHLPKHLCTCREQPPITYPILLLEESLMDTSMFQNAISRKTSGPSTVKAPKLSHYSAARAAQVTHAIQEVKKLPYSSHKLRSLEELPPFHNIIDSAAHSSPARGLISLIEFLALTSKLLLPPILLPFTFTIVRWMDSIFFLCVCWLESVVSRARGLLGGDTIQTLVECCKSLGVKPSQNAKADTGMFLTEATNYRPAAIASSISGYVSENAAKVLRLVGESCKDLIEFVVHLASALQSHTTQIIGTLAMKNQQVSETSDTVPNDVEHDDRDIKARKKWKDSQDREQVLGGIVPHTKLAVVPPAIPLRRTSASIRSMLGPLGLDIGEHNDPIKVAPLPKPWSTNTLPLSIPQPQSRNYG